MLGAGVGFTIHPKIVQDNCKRAWWNPKRTQESPKKTQDASRLPKRLQVNPREPHASA